MDLIERTIPTKDLLTKSNLPASDFVINPYVGCPHACKYCYARFMKRFTGHTEEWGKFIDIKICEKPIAIHKLTHKALFLSSVTDCYNPLEEKYQLTRNILKQLVNADCSITISTKSELILRDLDLLKQCKDLTVCISINTLDEDFQKDMDCASSIPKRIQTLRNLKQEGIYTVLFMSPMFPYLTDFRAIIENTVEFTEEYWFENLNLRGEYKHSILKYIAQKYPQYYSQYQQIYSTPNSAYWKELSLEIDTYCSQHQLNYKNYFYHEKLVANKKSNIKNSSRA